MRDLDWICEFVSHLVILVIIKTKGKGEMYYSN